MEKSFKELGAGRSVLIDKDGRIIAGNKSQKAAIAAGIKKVRIIETTGDELVAVKRTDISLDSKEGRELALADNLTTQVNLAWDEVELDKVAAQEGIDLPEWGIDPKSLGLQDPTETKEAQEDDFDEEKDKVETVCKKGDIWLLGQHRLMCGDSTSAEDVARLMDGEKADMCFTDPPYNVNIAGGVSRFDDNAEGLKILNDNFKTDDEAGEKLWLPAFTNIRANSKDQCAIYVSMPQGGTHMMMMMMMMAKAGWQVKHEIIWKKQSIVLGRQDYNYQHEPICYGWNKTHKFRGKGKFHNTSIWEIDRPTKSKEHPTMKPIALIEECLLDNSDAKDIVIDLFGGSGSTLIACEQLGRKARLMELDEHYCDVIIARWEKLTGNKATKLQHYD